MSIAEQGRGFFYGLLTARRVAILFGLLLLAALSWWLREIAELPPPSTARDLRHDPDQFMEHFAVTSLDAQGEPRYRLEADYMAHYPDDDTAELRAPRIVIHRGAKAAWHIEAAEGLIGAGRNDVLLRGEVVARRAAAPGGELQMRTSDLQLDLAKQLATTDRPVALLSPYGRSEALGMRADLTQDRLELNSRVRFEYAPLP